MQVVAGVLTKYVNIAKGWRDRLFVLSGDQLHYYKARFCSSPFVCLPPSSRCR